MDSIYKQAELSGDTKLPLQLRNGRNGNEGSQTEFACFLEVLRRTMGKKLNAGLPLCWHVRIFTEFP